MGKISLEGMEFFARHGVYEEEKIRGNKFSVDVSFDVDISKAAISDKLEDAINYEKIYEIVNQVMSKRSNLLEHLAQNILLALCKKFPEVKNTKVTISKHNPPINGLCKLAKVELNSH